MVKREGVRLAAPASPRGPDGTPVLEAARKRELQPVERIYTPQIFPECLPALLI